MRGVSAALQSATVAVETKPRCHSSYPVDAGVDAVHVIAQQADQRRAILPEYVEVAG